MHRLTFASTAMLALLTGCGGDSDGNSGTGAAPVVALPTPAPAPAATPAPAPAPAPTPPTTNTPGPAPTASNWAAGIAATYAAAPDVANCRAGTLTAAVRADVLARINGIRALHQMPAVTYADVDAAQAGEAALMMAANNSLDHTPPTSWRCYTAAGADGAGSGNLYLRSGTLNNAFFTEDDFLAGWLSEVDSASLGHRRWMLDPFLGRISYGRATQINGNSGIDSAVLKVFDFTGGIPAPGGMIPAFVAYPFGNYPARYFKTSAYLSFSAIPSSASRGANGGVRFTAATVTVREGSTPLAVSEISSDNIGYGVPNSIQWKVAGLRSGVTYSVTIAGVTGATQAQYSYDFRLVN